MKEVEKKHLPDEQENDVSKKEHAELLAILPSINAAAVIADYGESFGELSVAELANGLSHMLDKFNNGCMDSCEAMLLSQAHALQSIFVNLSRRAAIAENLARKETWLRLAFKAQNQCRSTLQTLATVQKPPVVFAKQANIAQGHQQVNNANSPDEKNKIW